MVLLFLEHNLVVVQFLIPIFTRVFRSVVEIVANVCIVTLKYEGNAVIYYRFLHLHGIFKRNSRFGPIYHAKFLQHSRHMLFNRRFRDGKLIRNLLVKQTV